MNRTNLKSFLGVIFFLTALSSNGNAQTPPAAIANSLQTILDNSLPGTFSNPGAIMKVAVPGEWSWSSASGDAIAGITAGQPQSTATADMQFRVGSITKVMVATCIMKLEQDGLLSIDDNIDNYLRSTLLNDTVNSSLPVTIRNLLNHTSGIANSADNLVCQQDVLTNPLGGHTLEDAIFCGASQGEVFGPGSSWGYSNTNYSLLAMLIEEVTGQSYPSFLSQTILTPVGLTNTIIPPSAQITNPHMGCYWNVSSWIDLTIVNSTTYTGWADVVSTTEDLILFYSALLNESIINAVQLDRMKTIDPASFNYGMGLDFYSINSINYFGHSGEVANTSGMFFVDIASQIAPNGYYISYNFNVQGAQIQAAIDQPVMDLLNQDLGINEQALADFNIYPNPTNGISTISLMEHTSETAIRIYDMQGQLEVVQLIPPFSTTYSLDLSRLPKGMYLVQIEGSKPQRLVIE